MSESKFDYKKEYKDLYLPKGKPSVIVVPPMRFIMVNGQGAPSGPAYQQAMETLYALSFTIKMSKLGAKSPKGILNMWCRPWRACGGARAGPWTRESPKRIGCGPL